MSASILFPHRRGFVAGLASLFAAPAIVSAASLMPVKAMKPAILVYGGGRSGGMTDALTLEMITREAVMLFKNSNAFLQKIEQQYTDEFGVGAEIGTHLRIRYPRDYAVSHVPGISIDGVWFDEAATLPIAPALSMPLAIAAGVAAVAHANPEVSRRSLFGFGRSPRRDTGNHMENVR